MLSPSELPGQRCILYYFNGKTPAGFHNDPWISDESLGARGPVLIPAPFQAPVSSCDTVSESQRNCLPGGEDRLLDYISVLITTNLVAQNNRNLFSRSLEAGNPKSRCQQGHTPAEALGEGHSSPLPASGASKCSWLVAASARSPCVCLHHPLPFLP